MISIIDYGMGNIGSILNMLKKIKVESQIVKDAEGIRSAQKLILPGVGSFDKGTENLAPLIETLNHKVLVEKIPILGICLGMQLLLEKSEEGHKDGLDWIRGESRRFEFDNKKYKVPHMGWNRVEPKNNNNLFHGFDVLPRFYFVHSYKVVPSEASCILGETVYGEPFCSALKQGNIYGVQFHPEKSHKYGMRLLKNYAEHC